MTPDTWHQMAARTLEREQRRDPRRSLTLRCSACKQPVPFDGWEAHVHRVHGDIR